MTRGAGHRVPLPACVLACLLVLASVAGACGSDDDPVSVVRQGFVAEVAGSTFTMSTLTFDELGCVADALLAVTDPATVSVIGRFGPRPDQAGQVVDALGTCDLIVTVFRLGVADLGPDPDCLLAGADPSDLAPVLEAELAASGDGVVSVGLLDTPMLTQLVWCTLWEDVDRAVGADAPPLCTPLVDAMVPATLVVLDAPAEAGLLAGLAGEVPRVVQALIDGPDAAVAADAAALVPVATALADAFGGLADDPPDEHVWAAVADTGDLLTVDEAGDAVDALDALAVRVEAACGEIAGPVIDLLYGVLEAAVAHVGHGDDSGLPAGFCDDLDAELLEVTTIVVDATPADGEHTGTTLAASVVATGRLLRWFADSLPGPEAADAERLADVYDVLADAVAADDTPELTLDDVRGRLVAALLEETSETGDDLADAAARVAERVSGGCGGHPVVAAIGDLFATRWS